MSRPTCILVIGAHRSGTSAVTRTLGLLGAAEARRLLPANEANSSGYWEAEAIVAAHDRFLEAVGSRWDDARPIPDGAFASEAADACRAELLAILHAEFSGRPLFVIKDPRLCRLAPLLLQALAAFGASPVVVSPVRPPGEAVRSLEAREGFSRMRCLAIWIGDVLEAERFTRGLPRRFVRLDDFRRRPVAAAEALARRLGCFPAGAAAAAAHDITVFWREAERREPAEDELLGEPMAVLAERLYERLSEAADGAPLGAAEMDEARARFGRFLRAAAYRRAALGEGLRELAGRVARKLGGQRG